MQFDSRAVFVFAMSGRAGLPGPRLSRHFRGSGTEVEDLSAGTDFTATAGRRPEGLLYLIKSNPKSIVMTAARKHLSALVPRLMWE
jgi:hypothetical protein